MHRQMKQFNKFCVSFPINKDASIALSKMQNVMTMCSNGYTPDDLGFTSDYNPYWHSDADWLSILSYNSYLVLLQYLYNVYLSKL